MKSLNQLVQFIEPSKTFKVSDVQLKDLQSDSRQLQAGDVFIALQGLSNHGLDYLQHAIDAQVACMLADRALTKSEQACLNAAHHEIKIVVLDDLPERLANIANWFYDQPCNQLKLVGITGTNGKTSTAHYLAQLLLQLGEQPALIGTLGNGLVTECQSKDLDKTVNTTPDVVTIFRLLNQFYQAGANWVIMEVSSHALALGRIKEMVFEAVALTQVTRDHLDFHGSEEHYRQTKAKLFTDYPSRHQVLNTNDSVGQALIDSGHLSKPFVYSVEPNPSAQLQCLAYDLNTRGIELDMIYQGLQSDQPDTERAQACLNLMGTFNIENVLCAASIVLASGFPLQSVVTLLPSLNAVNGRMHKVTTEPTVIVDFAHTPDALEQVLKALKPHVTDTSKPAALNTGQAIDAKVWVVFGCGGDRDRGKRPLMADVAERYADKVVLTSDNPRFENVQQIMTDIMAGFKKPQKVILKQARQKAIEYALVHAQVNDVVLIAGKGHENYQEIMGVKHPFSDQKVVLDWVSEQIHAKHL